MFSGFGTKTVQSFFGGGDADNKSGSSEHGSGGGGGGGQGGDLVGGLLSGGLSKLAGGFGGGGGGGGSDDASGQSAFQVGGPGGSSLGFTPGGGGLGDVNVNLGETFGGRGVKLGLGGQDGKSGGKGGFGIKFKGFTSGGGRSPRPTIKGRPQQREDKNPFSGLLKQHFDDIKVDLKGKGDGALFEDPEFLTEDSSLYYSSRPPRDIVWRRPHTGEGKASEGEEVGTAITMLAQEK